MPVNPDLTSPFNWELSPAQAREKQRELAGQVIAQDQLGTVQRVAGVDVGFEQQGTITRAAVVLLDFPSLTLKDYVIVRQPTRMPYIPGLLSFRECPAILAAMEKLTETPDLILCDGQGMAHPRRLGVACHIGVLTGLPTIGVAKSRLCGKHEEVPELKGSQVDLMDGSEVIGRVLRSRHRVRPLYVSIGHKVSLETAVHYVQACTTQYRLPETTRWADALASDRGRAVAKADRLLGR